MGQQRSKLAATVLAYLAAVAALPVVDAVANWLLGACRQSDPPATGADGTRRMKLMIVTTLNAAALFAGAWMGARTQGRGGTIARLGLGPSNATWAGLGAAVTGLLALSVAVGEAANLLGLRSHGLSRTLAESFASCSPTTVAAGVITVAIAPAIAEEALCRGLVQVQFARSWGRWPGIAAGSGAFGLLHGDAVQAPLACIIGLFLGWTAEQLRGVRPTLVAHAVNNALFILTASAGISSPQSRAHSAELAACGALVWIASVAVLRSETAQIATSSPSGGRAVYQRPSNP